VAAMPAGRALGCRHPPFIMSLFELEPVCQAWRQGHSEAHLGHSVTGGPNPKEEVAPRGQGWEVWSWGGDRSGAFSGKRSPSFERKV
jgi:hypothetical protein